MAMIIRKRLREAVGEGGRPITPYGECIFPEMVPKRNLALGTQLDGGGGDGHGDGNFIPCLGGGSVGRGVVDLDADRIAADTLSGLRRCKLRCNIGVVFPSTTAARQPWRAALVIRCCTISPRPNSISPRTRRKKSARRLQTPLPLRPCVPCHAASSPPRGPKRVMLIRTAKEIGRECHNGALPVACRRRRFVSIETRLPGPHRYTLGRVGS